MDDLIITNPSTWAQARWPFPRPTVIRTNADFKDDKQRSFMAVGDHDRANLRLRRGHRWFWCALPPTSVQTGMVRPVPNLRDIIRAGRVHYRVIGIGRMVDPKRGLGIVALK